MALSTLAFVLSTVCSWRDGRRVYFDLVCVAEGVLSGVPLMSWRRILTVKNSGG